MIIGRSFTSYLTAARGPSKPWDQGVVRQPDWSVENSALEYMEEHDISTCVLSDPDLGNTRRGQEARDIARRCVNETLRRDIVSDIQPVFLEPARDLGPAGLPDGAAGREMLMRRHIEDGRGSALRRATRCLSRRSRRFDPWFEELNRQRTNLFVRPSHKFTKAQAQTLHKANPSVLEVLFDNTRNLIANIWSLPAPRRASPTSKSSQHGGAPSHFPGWLAGLNGSSTTRRGAWTRLELSPEEVRDGFIASFYYDLTATNLRGPNRRQYRARAGWLFVS